MSRLVFGVGPVRELLRSRRGEVSALWVSRARAERGERRGAQDAADPVAELAAEARKLGVAVELREPPELDAAAGGANHQGVVAVAGAYRYAAIEDVIARAGAAAPALVVALDSVTDPHNLGAVARSAWLFGATALVVPKDRAAEVTPAAVKASAGATEHLMIAQVTNLARALGELKEAGVWIAAVASADDAIPPSRLDATLPLCLVLGAEGTGIRPLVARQADFRVAIPMARAAVGSFNVSVAAGIAMYEIARQRAR
ncbi:MAG TPA: 23S rRNA (guanosine(2251)-2'-O)-methyltransferase RlmB [Kofleriaceae bacterium]|nr:23S rRNA (guanosine(2251)-2'-O)-methyltransferase RlmB [Kofleriaceae bacterium]